MAHVRTRMARGERGLVAEDLTKKRRHWIVKDTSRIGATRLSIPVEQYRANVEAGQKWCSGHQVWHALASTQWVRRRDSRSGLAGSCAAWYREYQAARRMS